MLGASSRRERPYIPLIFSTPPSGPSARRHRRAAQTRDAPMLQRRQHHRAGAFHQQVGLLQSRGQAQSPVLQPRRPFHAAPIPPNPPGSTVAPQSWRASRWLSALKRCKQMRHSSPWSFQGNGARQQIISSPLCPERDGTRPCGACSPKNRALPAPHALPAPPTKHGRCEEIPSSGNR